MGALLNFNFFNVNPKFDNEIAKFTSKNAWIQIFATYLKLVRVLLDVGIIANAKF